MKSREQIVRSDRNVVARRRAIACGLSIVAAGVASGCERSAKDMLLREEPIDRAVCRFDPAGHGPVQTVEIQLVRTHEGAAELRCLPATPEISEASAAPEFFWLVPGL